MKTLSLALPKTKLQPPPKKSEIIDALTKIRVQQLDDESERDAKEEREKLEEELKPQLVSYAITNVHSLLTDINLGSCWDKEKKLSGVKVYIEFQHKDLSIDLIAKLRKIHSLPERARKHVPYDIRKEITAEVNGMMPHDTRVKALLDDKVSREALEKMLEAIGV